MSLWTEQRQRKGQPITRGTQQLTGSCSGVNLRETIRAVPGRGPYLLWKSLLHKPCPLHAGLSAALHNATSWVIPNPGKEM